MFKGFVKKIRFSVRPFVLFCLLLTGIIITLFPACVPANANDIQIKLSDAIALSKSHNLSEADIDLGSDTMVMVASVSGDPIKINDIYGNTATINNGTLMITNIGSLTLADLTQLGFVLPATYNVNSVQPVSWTSIIFYFVLPFLVLTGFLIFLGRPSKNALNQGLNFARSKLKGNTKETTSITFADVAGVEEAKEDLQEVVEFLKDPTKFQKIGAKIPKGVLLLGPPGTGKTLLARAVAGEANVPFFSVSGSEFVEIFVGMGAARVRDLFGQAKHSAPCIIFIDEIDAVGGKRIGSAPGGEGEREQTLNQILTEMDGFDPNTDVIVLAATNRPDVLDPALLRPGRFDRRVTLDLPDINARIAILKIHARGKVVDKAVDLASIARQTHGFSGADLADLMNEAAILAVRRNKASIGMVDIEDSVDRIIAGPERRSLKVNPRDKEMTAYHEAGHALVAFNVPGVAPLQKISIVARGSMGGFTRLLNEDRFFMTVSQFKGNLATMVGGYTAEEMIFHETSTGPESDIKQATELAEKMIMDFGMSEKLGFRTFNHDATTPYMPGEKDYSEETAKEIDSEINRLLEEAHEIAKKILEENKPRLIHVAEKLIVVETLVGPELEKAFIEPIGENEKAPAEAASVIGQVDVSP